MGHCSKTERNPVKFINILRRYSKEDYGALFLYLPSPSRPVDEEVWAWLSMMRRMGSARKRWMISADHAAILLEHTHPHLFTPPPVCFEVYRLNHDCVMRIFSKL